MAIIEANVSFDHGGRQVKVGDLFDTTHYLYALFPSRFTAVTSGDVSAASVYTGATATTASTLGTVIKNVEVFNTGGTSLGFVPIYDAIT